MQMGKPPPSGFGKTSARRCAVVWYFGKRERRRSSLPLVIASVAEEDASVIKRIDWSFIGRSRRRTFISNCRGDSAETQTICRRGERAESKKQTCQSDHEGGVLKRLVAPSRLPLRTGVELSASWGAAERGQRPKTRCVFSTL